MTNGPADNGLAAKGTPEHKARIIAAFERQQRVLRGNAVSRDDGSVEWKGERRDDWWRTCRNPLTGRSMDGYGR